MLKTTTSLSAMVVSTSCFAAETISGDDCDEPVLSEVLSDLRAGERRSIDDTVSCRLSVRDVSAIQGLAENMYAAEGEGG